MGWRNVSDMVCLLLVAYPKYDIAPTLFRRQAVAYMVSYEKTTDGLVFPHRQKARLCISIVEEDPKSGNTRQYRNTLPSSQSQLSSSSPSNSNSNSVEDLLTAAQSEIVEQEIFSFLVKEAGELPSVSTRVSERLIVIDAAQGLTLKFEMVGIFFSGLAKVWTDYNRLTLLTSPPPLLKTLPNQPLAI